MGSGKTAVGRRVAQRLSRPFVDLDEAIVARTGRPIPDLFAAGEATFRAAEVDTLASILAQYEGEEAVVALGGGTLTTESARRLLAESGALVAYLRVDPDTAWERVRGGNRPLARDRGSFAALLQARQSVYEKSAVLQLDAGAGRAPDQLAGAVIQALRDRETLPPEEPAGWRFELTSTARPSTVRGGVACLGTLTQAAGQASSRGRRLLIVADEHVWSLWGEEVQTALTTEAGSGPAALRLIPPGEVSKSVPTVTALWEWLASSGARRDDVIVAVGGGMVGDLAGFAAATFLRGMELWQVPTSLLAQVDSSVGGKVAVNLAAGKNLVGAFHQAGLVVADARFLRTLSPEELASGLGEVVKYALLEGPRLFGLLEARAEMVTVREEATLAGVVKDCVAYKIGVVAEDETDLGRRAVLNLGHTIGHALEATLGYGRVAHGAAVALGLLGALRISEELLGADPGLRARTSELLRRLGLRRTLPLPPVDHLLRAMGQDKKVTAAGRGLVGLRSLGEPVVGLEVPDGVLREALEVIRD